MRACKQMSNTFTPRPVPSEIIASWPSMALSLWRRSFRPQAIVLMSVAFLLKLFPAWATPAGFVLAPSLFVVAFAVAQVADERKLFSWQALGELVLPGAVRLCGVALKFAAGFAALAGALALLATTLVRHSAVDEQQAAFAAAIGSARATVSMPDTLGGEFLHFCATWMQGVMAMMFLGMFIVAIYQGVFGAILHAQQGMEARAARRLGWQAWQVNAGAIEEALRAAPASFWLRTVLAGVAIAAAFQSVYFSPAGLLLATYVPCLAYVAFRSIFLGRHENVPAALRSGETARGPLVPAMADIRRAGLRA